MGTTGVYYLEHTPAPAEYKLKIPAASCRQSSTVRNAVFIMIRSLTPPQAAGNALAVQFKMVMIGTGNSIVFSWHFQQLYCIRQNEWCLVL
jgi:hypothetical protein